MSLFDLSEHDIISHTGRGISKRSAEHLRSKGMKYCPKCETAKRMGQFPKDKNSRDGLFGYCHECRRKYRREYAKTQAKFLSAQRIHLKRYWVERLGGVCVKCGYGKGRHHYLSAMDFHHVDPMYKEYAPSIFFQHGNGYTDEQIEIELDKCALLCRNCHAGFEAGLWVGTFKQRDDIGWTLEGA